MLALLPTFDKCFRDLVDLQQQQQSLQRRHQHIWDSASSLQLHRYQLAACRTRFVKDRMVFSLRNGRTLHETCARWTIATMETSTRVPALLPISTIDAYTTCLVSLPAYLTGYRADTSPRILWIRLATTFYIVQAKDPRYSIFLDLSSPRRLVSFQLRNRRNRDEPA